MVGGNKINQVYSWQAFLLDPSPPGLPGRGKPDVLRTGMRVFAKNLVGLGFFYSGLFRTSIY